VMSYLHVKSQFEIGAAQTVDKASRAAKSYATCQQLLVEVEGTGQYDEQKRLCLFYYEQSRRTPADFAWEYVVHHVIYEDIYYYLSWFGGLIASYLAAWQSLVWLAVMNTSVASAMLSGLVSCLCRRRPAPVTELNGIWDT